MNLQDFNTLAEAQAHAQVIDKKQVGSGQARGYLVGIGVWKTLRTLRTSLEHPLSDLADAVIITAADASSFFGLDPETAEGQGNIGSIGIFVDAGILTQTEADGFLGLALSSTYPYATATQAEFDEAKDSGEIVNLPANHSQHAYQINTTNQPLKPTDIMIEHRFGADKENLTDWIEVGSVRGVYYPTTMTGSPYKSGQVAASDANVREIRLVCSLTLGIVVA